MICFWLFYVMVIYVTFTILTEHGILSLLRAKLSLLIRFNTYNIGQIEFFFCFKKKSKKTILQK